MIVGHKRLIYVIDKADETRKETRDSVKNFFKESLGFTEEEIIIVDRDDFSSEKIESECATTGKKQKDKFRWLFN